MAKKKTASEKPKEISPEENILTREEFEKLEKKESKKGRLFRLFKKKERKAPEAYAKEVKGAEGRRAGGISLEEMQMNIEKINGKLELIDNFRESSEERFVKLGEEIGELRSSLMGQEAVVGKIDAGFEKLEEMVKEIEPGKIVKERLKMMKLTEENSAKIDVLNKKIKVFSDNLKRYRKSMEKIKNIENLVKMLKNAEILISKIKDSENNTRRLSSKVEKMFAEIGTRMTKADKQSERIDKLDGLINEAAGSLEGIEIKLKATALKDDFEKFRDSMKKDFSLFRKNSDDRLHELKDLVNMVVSAMEEMKKGKPELPEKKEEMAEAPKEKAKPETPAEEAPKEEKAGKKKEEMPELPEKEEAVKEKPEVEEYFRIRNLIRKCNQSMDMGDTDTAENLYMEIVELYKKIMESGRKTEEVQGLYEDIMDLHNNLQAELSSS